MPNWCSNDLVVHGTEERLEEFKKAFKGKLPKWGLAGYETRGKSEEEIAVLEEKYEKEYEEQELVYRFNALYPVPEEVLAVGFSGERPMGTTIIETLSGKGKWYDGYTWCVSHWGTKWDVDMYYVHETEEELIFQFDTAWSPAVEWLYKVAQDWDDLSFELKYEEPGCQFAGYIMFENGEQTHHDHVDGDEYRQFVIDNFDYDPYEGYEDDELEEMGVN